MKKPISGMVLVFAVLFFAVAHSSDADAGAICNNSSVSDGDMKIAIVQKCGAPVACQQSPVYNGQNIVGTREECLFYTDFNQRTFYFFNNVLQAVR